MKKISFLFILSILVIGSSYDQIALALSNPNLEWEAKQEGIIYSIGTDYNNSYLLYSLGFDDWSKTRITRYSDDGQIILNKTVGINYAFFHACEKIFDKWGNFYLVDRGTEGLQIYNLTIISTILLLTLLVITVPLTFYLVNS